MMGLYCLFVLGEATIRVCSKLGGLVRTALFRSKVGEVASSHWDAANFANPEVCLDKCHSPEKIIIKYVKDKSNALRTIVKCS